MISLSKLNGIWGNVPTTFLKSYTMKHKKQLFSPIVAAIFLGGCTLLPASFQMASLALDGISMLTTQKSLTDHGISYLSQKDCAVWRGIMDGQLCRDAIETPTPVMTATLQLSAPRASHQPGARPQLDGLYLSVM